MNKEFLCDLCARTYNSKQLLVLHLNSHIGIRDGLFKLNNIIIFTCDLCAKSYNIKQTLELHLSKHKPIHLIKDKGLGFEKQLDCQNDFKKGQD